MHDQLHHIYRYRQLIAKCDAGVGLDIDEIEATDTIERFFSSPDHRRRFLRAEFDHDATLLAGEFTDRVRIVDIGLTGGLLDDVPYLEVGQTVELRISDLERGHCYRFKAEVVWVEDNTSGSSAGVAFLGAPVLVRGSCNVKRERKEPSRPGRFDRAVTLQTRPISEATLSKLMPPVKKAG